MYVIGPKLDTQVERTQVSLLYWCYMEMLPYIVLGPGLLHSTESKVNHTWLQVELSAWEQTDSFKQRLSLLATHMHNAASGHKPSLCHACLSHMWRILPIPPLPIHACTGTQALSWQVWGDWRVKLFKSLSIPVFGGFTYPQGDRMLVCMHTYTAQHLCSPLDC